MIFASWLIFCILRHQHLKFQKLEREAAEMEKSGATRKGTDGKVGVLF